MVGHEEDALMDLRYEDDSANLSRDSDEFESSDDEYYIFCKSCTFYLYTSMYTLKNFEETTLIIILLFFLEGGATFWANRMAYSADEVDYFCRTKFSLR